MRLASYKAEGRRSYGAVSGETIVDIPGLLKAAGRGPAPADALALVAAGEEVLASVRAALEAGFGEQAALRRASVEFLPPLPNPGKMICVGRNYAEHAKEAGFEMSPVPILFPRFANTLIGHGASVIRPKVSEQLD